MYIRLYKKNKNKFIIIYLLFVLHVTMLLGYNDSI